MRTLIIGGVAAGASAAARLRRLDERRDIVMFERGPYISYANCGLPYHISGVVEERDWLLVMTPEEFAAEYNIEARINSEVLSIDRAAKEIAVRGPGGEVYRERYDSLLVATGSSPLLPDIPGIDLPGVMRLWSIPDMDRVMAALKAGAKAALVIGAGFIGIETAENLRARGIEVTVVEMADQILSALDREMTTPLEEEVERLGIGLRIGKRVVAFSAGDGGAGLRATLDDGSTLAADFAVVGAGVRPNSALAAEAGLTLGERGHIRVDDFMRTNDPAIYAAGDVVEVRDSILGGRVAVPLAGPANRQGRVAADNMAGRSVRYAGCSGASIVKVGNLAAGCVGHSERRLGRMGVEYRKVYLSSLTNAGYFPDSERLTMKLLFAPSGQILGAQITGPKGVDKRVDVIATAMQAGMGAGGLVDLELSYSPPFNTPRDPVNQAGMVAANVLSGETRLAYPDAIPEGATLLDVREPGECKHGALPGMVNIPIGQLRERMPELDKARPLVVYCQVGHRGYVAERVLRQNGFDVYNLSGGFLAWKLHQGRGR